MNILKTDNMHSIEFKGRDCKELPDLFHEANSTSIQNKDNKRVKNYRHI